MMQLFSRVLEETSLDDLMPLIRERLDAGQLVRICPYGVSMLPMLREGIDSVVLSKAKSIKKYDVILYQRENGKYVLHRVVGVGETYTCIGDNQFVFETGIAHDRVIAVCAAFTRGKKEYSANALRWRVYAVLWHHSRSLRRLAKGAEKKLRGLLKRIKRRIQG